MNIRDVTAYAKFTMIALFCFSDYYNSMSRLSGAVASSIRCFIHGTNGELELYHLTISGTCA